MNLHANAALSLKGRRELCRAVVERRSIGVRLACMRVVWARGAATAVVSLTSCRE